LDSDRVVSCTDSAPDGSGYASIADGLDLLSNAETAYGHNVIGFDDPALKKVYPSFSMKGCAIKDTLIIAQMRWAHVKDSDFVAAKRGKFPMHLAGRHSLEAWGYRLGIHKGEYTRWCKEQGITEPFAVWRPEMQTYCEGDTATTKALVLHIQKSGISAEAVDTELRLRWYLLRQEANGWPFDLDKALALQGTLVEKREVLAKQLAAFFPPWVRSLGMFTPKVNSKKFGYVKGVPIEKTKVIEFNPSSTAHIAERLITLYGWKPTAFTPTGLPQVDEKALKPLTFPPIPTLLEYLLIEKRLEQLSEGKQGWLRHARTDPSTGLLHIYGGVKQSGTITHRASHVNPNLGQVPKVGKPYGEECRAMFYVPKGWVQLGADASGLEARIIAHFVSKYDGGAYGKLILEGDIHTANMRAFYGAEKIDGCTPEERKTLRDRAKTAYYAWLYGCGDEKMGATLFPDANPSTWPALGKKAIAGMLKNAPGLQYLIDAVGAAATEKGYLKSLDGRRVYVRSAHAALNTLIQTAGAIICKKWIVNYDTILVERFGQQGWNGQWAALGWIHDEVQLAVRPEIVEEVKTILVQEIEKLTTHYAFRCPLTGEAKVGGNWKETH
jgi:hypothetical protein